MRSLRWGYGMVLICLSAMQWGCAGGSKSDTASVKGTVTWNGQPIEQGVVLFVYSPGKDSAEKIMVPAKIQQGAYSLDVKSGPVVGKNRIEIRAMKNTGETREVFSDPAPGSKEVKSQLVEVQRHYIPKQYNDDSTLTEIVQSGENKFDFALTGEELQAESSGRQ